MKTTLNNANLCGVSTLSWDEINQLDKSINPNLVLTALNVKDSIAVIACHNHQIILMDMEAPENYVTFQKRNINKIVGQLIKADSTYAEVTFLSNMEHKCSAIEEEAKYNDKAIVGNFAITMSDLIDLRITDLSEQVDTAGYQITFFSGHSELLALAIMLTKNTYMTKQNLDA